MTVRSIGSLDTLLEGSAPPGIFVFHGEDGGLVNECARKAVQSFTPDLNDPFAVVRLTGSILALTPGRLAEEAGTIGLFAGVRSIWIDAVGSQAISSIEDVPSDWLQSTRIVVEAGELRRDSPLLRFAERSELAAAFECENLSRAAIAKFAGEELARNGLNASTEVKEILSSILPADWLSCRSELEKLCTYASGGAEVGVMEVVALIAGGEAIVPDDVVDSALTGNFDKLERAWGRAKATGLDGGVIAGFALRRLLYRRTGQSRILDDMSPEDTRTLMQNLWKAIRDGRLEGRLSDLFAQRAFWGVTARAKRG